ncbi:hypothetical protein [Spirosoma endophyticum]|uniref:Uncharacterized protein n=1 Tax=Spirosoma endophyticum TaxID=662367 RepID=A0A1I2GMB1_9BACT|nr:hypothetical protein [Spirosoma endophyticum]SFF17741.1 hypothetical protein SAMN05216167_13325 [Spirosoma endophyticum]
MRQVRIRLGLLLLLAGCNQDAAIKPDEVEATIKGYVIADNWSKSGSSGGLVIKINRDSYLISNSIPSDYENSNAWPVPVWVRYESASPDSCSQATNRVNILSIRRRS